MLTGPVPPALRVRLGVDASEDLVEMFTTQQALIAERFESRVVREASALRIELERGLANIRVDVERVQSSVIRWTVLLWFGQFAAIVGVLQYMTRGL